jgi:hypothetical protein
MDDFSGETPCDGSACESTVLHELLTGLQAKQEDKEWRRHMPRGDSDSGQMIELRRQNGATRMMRVQNVSTSGVCVISRSEIAMDEIVEIRVLDEEGRGEYELFQVAHVTTTLGGFKVGMSLAGQPENQPT